MTQPRSLGMSRRNAQRTLGFGIFVFIVGSVWAAFGFQGAGADDGRVFEIDNDPPRSLTCDDLGALLIERGILTSLPDWEEFKIDNPTGSGTYPTPFGITISDFDGTSFHWTSTVGIDAVFVKSGSGSSRLYLYDPPKEAFTGAGGTQQDISHITFCVDDGGTTTTTTTSTTRASTTTVSPSTLASSTSASTTTITTIATTTRPASSTSIASSSSTTTAFEIPATVAPQVLAEVEVRSQPGENVLARTGFPAGALVSLAGALLIVGSGLSLLGHRRTNRSS